MMLFLTDTTSEKAPDLKEIGELRFIVTPLTQVYHVHDPMESSTQCCEVAIIIPSVAAVRNLILWSWLAILSPSARISVPGPSLWGREASWKEKAVAVVNTRGGGGEV